MWKHISKMESLFTVLQMVIELAKSDSLKRLQLRRSTHLSSVAGWTGHRISGVESSISENGIANTSVCVPVSCGMCTLIHDEVAEVQFGSATATGMVSVLTVWVIHSSYKPVLLWSCDLCYLLWEWIRNDSIDVVLFLSVSYIVNLRSWGVRLPPPNKLARWNESRVLLVLLTTVLVCTFEVELHMSVRFNPK